MILTLEAFSLDFVYYTIYIQYKLYKLLYMSNMLWIQHTLRVQE